MLNLQFMQKNIRLLKIIADGYVIFLFIYFHQKTIIANQLQYDCNDKDIAVQHQHICQISAGTHL